MSLKFKLKRAFVKARKFLIVTLVLIIFVCIFAFSVSADTVRKTSFLTFTSARATDYADSEFSNYYTLYPNNLNSPFGGIAQGFMLPQNVDDTTTRGFRGINSNMYFDNFTFKKDIEYNISFKIFLPYNFLEQSTGSIAYQLNNLVSMQATLCDKNRKERFKFVPQIKEEYNSNDYLRYKFNKYWLNENLVHTTTQLYSFYECSASFTPGEDFVGSFFNFYFNNSTDLPSTHYFFGFSDLVLSYEVNPLIDQNYNKIDGSSVNEHNNLSNSIESQTAEGRKEFNAILGGIINMANSDLFQGLLAWTKIINFQLDSAGWYYELLRFSLAVGLFGFILGLSIYALNISKFGRRRSDSSKNNKGGGG